MNIIMHIDVNSAYLSWTAVNLLKNGYGMDIREVPSVIAGNPENRHGIILAKSMKAKPYGIKTADSLFEARQKCPELLVFPPEYDLYLSCSDAMYELLLEYSPQVQRYSVDECFMDYTFSLKKFGDPVEVAYTIKERIKKELGFTVNVGVSTNKLLAKMGSELEKPDKVHTLFTHEIEEKLWPLPVEELFMVGRATTRKLKKININTIRDLANADKGLLKSLLKSHGNLIWNYANGIDVSSVVLNSDVTQKGVGNSMTIDHDVTAKREANKYILSLTERVSMRLRRLRCVASLISISVKTDSFSRYTHQVQLGTFTDATSIIYRYACMLFDECWKGEPVRQIGVSVSNLKTRENMQISIFDDQKEGDLRKIDSAVDEIRKKFGEKSVIRGTFADGKQGAIEGGVNDGDYLMMGGYRI